MIADEGRVIARVDYQVCALCGFRLMRVETTVVGGQQLVTRHCPICGQSELQHPRTGDDGFDAEVQRRFDDWLQIHGLNRETLEKHYHLKIEDFFEPLLH